MVLGFWDIAVPIVGAPMAGGPSTPALAAAVSNAGGLGFVAGGYLSADRLADDIAAARAATTGPIGANLFVPQPSVADWAQLEYYADELEEVAEYYHTEVRGRGQPGGPGPGCRRAPRNVRAGHGTRYGVAAPTPRSDWQRP